MLQPCCAALVHFHSPPASLAPVPAAQPDSHDWIEAAYLRVQPPAWGARCAPSV